MKKSIVFLLLLMLSVTTFSQPTINNDEPTTKSDYLQKSKKQSTVALATSIPGVVLVTIGGIMYMSEFGNGLIPGGDYQEETFNAGGIFILAGSALIMVAIPFHLAARKNKKIAMSLGFKNVPMPELQKNNPVAISVPSLSLKINL
ncbi:MAG: hypothetical protein IPP39_09750 [Chitinophagaceae bacterium]|nr:hypothetical protein [Chitinophagaceae bacterium]